MNSLAEESLEIIKTELPGVLLIKPRVFNDTRGFFYESYRHDRLEELGITETFVQDNHSRSARGTLRGLHYQLRHPQAKICRVVSGEVLDVAVDIRRGSPSFGNSVSAVLSAENKSSIFIPAGFAHGFLVLSDSADFLYKCTDYYYPDDQFGIVWNDPALDIPWGIANPLLSDKDRRHVALAKTPVQNLPIYQAGTR
jgi:dTDP-4-dehydrorhamnose 3,5-epimerase